ncbi:PQQ-binding-like beta-propeller repeat protein [Frondihabitans peucedani]|uniref:Pyrrolo-quinoline quinone repeat domain-containing protein n=1 Tax=Frondihabitans peucedani TaxID=598626 RepID=A0ABP8DZ45_9MICO
MDEVPPPVDPEWSPPRPPAPASVWAAAAGRDRVERGRAEHDRAERAPEPDGDDLPTFTAGGRRPPPTGSRTRGSLRRLWARIGRGRRILLSYAGLAALIVAVTAVGAALQPSYGALPGWQGIRVDDLRSAPRTSPWAVDLASTLAPGSPPECLRFTGVDVGQDLVAVRADSPSDTGSVDDPVCSMVPEGFRSRVALLDTATGDVRWVHDVAADLSASGGVAVSSTSVVDDGSRLLIRAGTSSQAVVESLSLGTGQVLESTGAMPWSQEDRFTAGGRVVATGRLSPDGLSYVYELRDVDDLSHVVWTGPGNETATMIALSDRLLLGDTATVQIPLATGVPRAWGAPVDTTLGYAVRDDVVYSPHTTGSGVTTTPSGGFSAIDRDGRVLWSSDLGLRGSYSLTRSCLAVTNRAADRLSCLDYRTGAVRWTTGVSTFSYAGSAVGQRTDDVFTASTTDRARVVALSGSTGHQRFSADVPVGSYVVAAGHTVVYALAYGIAGSRSTVIALDASSGARLWTHDSGLQVSVWGGHLIDVGRDGLARRLDG